MVFRVETEVKRKTAFYGIVAVLLAVLIGVFCYNFASFYETALLEQPGAEPTFLQSFSSYEELVSFLEANLQTTSQYTYYNTPSSLAWRTNQFLSAVGKSVMLLSVDSARAPPEYSTTNVQVEGVDEADIMKTDGTFLYVASNNSLFILKAYPPEDMEVLSRIDFNGTLIEIFLNGDKLAILGACMHFDSSTFRNDKTLVDVYDVSDSSNPVLARNFSISGNYFDSRMIDEYVYLIASQPAYLIYDTLVLPKVYSGENMKEVEASQIYYSNVSDSPYAFTTVAAISIEKDEQEPTHKTLLLGATSCMYVSLNNIYVTFWTENQGTLVYRIHIEDEAIETEAWGEVPGSVLNQFSMDEYNGYFRIATTTRTTGTSQNNVYVLDMNLALVGTLENIAPGERIYSARFMGDGCYLVTFKKVDPLFVLDLKDPSSPEVLGWLKITGYSDYLHPYDENHIIGIGKETVAAEEGNFAWYQGVKISFFDVTDVENPKEIDKYEIGDRATDSPVLTDHKALLFDKSKNLIVIPVLVAEIDEEQYPSGVPPYAYGDYVWQGAYVFDITLDKGLVLKGRITHLENNMDLWTETYWVKRSLYIDDALYTISDRKVMTHNLETLDEINQIELS